MRVQPAVSEGDFFREMTLRICGSLDIDEALRNAFAYLREHMPADAMGLGYSDGPRERVHVVGYVKRAGTETIWDERVDEIVLPPEMLEYQRMRAPIRPPVVTINRVMPEQQPLLRVFPGLTRQSALFLRLDVGDEEFGNLVISAEGPDRYRPEHAALVETLREPVAIAMVNARRYRELQHATARLTEDHRALSADLKRTIGAEVVGADFGLRDVMEQVRQVAPSSSATLLLGETGTGKEVIANAIHRASPRSQGPLISMQCGAIPETLLDSELFGHEKGAFTGASERKRGRFERAHGGTLFLDEIGELSAEAQVKLLRVLQERRFERVGGTETIEVDVRVIAATHRDLEQRVREGRFREDLWYRLNVLPIRIPPLRLRRADVPSLVQYFVERKSQEMGLSSVPALRSADLARLEAYDWPGNVRELQNVVERALILSRGGPLRFPDLGSGAPPPVRARPAASGSTLATLDEAIAEHIRAALDRTGGQVAGPGGAAEILAMNPSTLRFRMQKLGIRPAGSRHARGAS